MCKVTVLPFQSGQLLQLPARSEAGKLRKDHSLLFLTREDDRLRETQRFFQRAPDRAATVSRSCVPRRVSKSALRNRATATRRERALRNSPGCRSSERTISRLKLMRGCNDAVAESTYFSARIPPGGASLHPRVLQTQKDPGLKARRARLPSGETRSETHRLHPRALQQ